MKDMKDMKEQKATILIGNYLPRPKCFFFMQKLLFYPS